MADPVGSHGTLIKIGDGGSPEAFTTIARVKDIKGPGVKNDVEDVTCQDSAGWKEKLATISDGGQVTFELQFIPTNATHSYSAGLLKDAYNRTKRNFQLVWPDSGNTTWTFAAYVAQFLPSGPVKGVLGGSVTLEVTGTPTFA